MRGEKDVSFVRFRQKPARRDFAIPPQLSNVFRNLTPKNGGRRQQKGNSTEKTPIFEVFRKVLIDKLLHDCLSVNVRFTKSKFARGKVSLRERYRFVVWKDMFEATKHGVWRGQSLCLAVRKLTFRKMKDDEWRVKSRFLQILTSLSSLFPDKVLSIYLVKELNLLARHLPILFLIYLYFQ